MYEVRIDGTSDYFTVIFSEFGGHFGEVDDFGGADEGEIERIEEE